jgi:hypothetical protein
LVFRYHRNPVYFYSPKLRKLGIFGDKRARALRELEQAGFIQVRPSKKGMSLLVACLWRPLSRASKR